MKQQAGTEDKRIGKAADPQQPTQDIVGKCFGGSSAYKEIVLERAVPTMIEFVHRPSVRTLAVTRPTKVSIPPPIGMSPRSFLAVVTLISCSSSAIGQTVAERILGRITSEHPISGAHVISARGDRYARRERHDGKERYTTLEGPQEWFDRLHHPCMLPSRSCLSQW
jgi:hypothetical protein